ncbi:MAG: peptide deformylase [Thermoproteota archaeon]|jgi:peptide deformylase
MKTFKILALFLMSTQVLTLSHAHTVSYFSKVPLKIITIGHPTLTMVADEIPFDDIKSDEIQNLIDNMFVTMKKANGVGLAAPQINRSIRLYVMQPKSSRAPEAIINPVIEYIDEGGTKMSREGCLSIPGKSFRVKRYKEIHLSYFNRKGEYLSERAKGFRAIVAQHEYDHLNGILISDFFNTKYVNLEEEGYDIEVPLM